MRVFDSIDEVREHFELEAKVHRNRAITFAANPPKLSKAKRDQYIVRNEAIAMAYADAAKCLTEIRPGFVEALHRRMVERERKAS